ncbi:MAG TPA: hypothetical protein VGE16_03845 [Albitalea sp.]
MPNANRPSGPGKPINERRDAAVESEEMDELGGEAQADEASSRVRQAERDAHDKSKDVRSGSGTSRDRRP